MTSRRSQCIPLRMRFMQCLRSVPWIPMRLFRSSFFRVSFFFSFLLSLFDFLIGCWLGAACMGLILVIHVLLLVFSLLGFVAFGLLCNGFDLILVFFFFFVHWGFVMWEMGIILVFAMMGFHCWCTFCKVKLEMPISCLCYCLLSNSEREAFF